MGDIYESHNDQDYYPEEKEEKKFEERNIDCERILNEEIKHNEDLNTFGKFCSGNCIGNTIRCVNKNCRRTYCYQHLEEKHHFEHIDNNKKPAEWKCPQCVDSVVEVIDAVIAYIKTFNNIQYTNFGGKFSKEKSLSSSQNDANWIGFSMRKIVGDATKEGTDILDSIDYQKKGTSQFRDNVYHMYQNITDNTPFRQCFNLAD
eukprot:320243_1